MRAAMLTLVMVLASTVPATAEPAKPALTWRPCQVDNAAYQCTTVEVPVDWSKPGGRRISLMVAKLPTTDPARRIGAVLFNSGGPGGPSVSDLAPDVDKVADLRRQFDVVTWNPRGAFTTWPESQRAGCEQTGPTMSVPEDEAAYEQKARENGAIADKCREQDPELFANMDAEAHARDLEAIRTALGEPSLNYFGQSYGGVIGASYTRLFPAHVRTMFLDSVVNHVATGVRAERLQAAGRNALFNRFADWCRTTSSCTLHGRDLREAWRSLVEQADRQPIPVAGTQLRYSGADLEIGIQPFLTVGRFAELDKALDLARRGDATGLTAPTRGQKPWVANLYRGTQCADGFFPQGYRRYRHTMELGKWLAPEIPRAQSGQTSACIGWPKVSNPPRPIPTFELPPILGAAGINDIDDVRYVTHQVPGSAVIEVPGIFHGVYLAADNRCVRGHANRYFADRTLPPRETTCPVTG